jgi:hypothetical protein
MEPLWDFETSGDAIVASGLGCCAPANANFAPVAGNVDFVPIA